MIQYLDLIDLFPPMYLTFQTTLYLFKNAIIAQSSWSTVFVATGPYLEDLCVHMETYEANMLQYSIKQLSQRYVPQLCAINK